MSRTPTPDVSPEPPQPSTERVRYIVHPTPPDADGERRLCAHVVAHKTYAMTEFAEEVAKDHRLLDAESVLYVLQCAHETTKRLLRSGNSIAFKNQFTLQLSITGTLEPGEVPDPTKGHQLRPRVRIAPALIQAINQGIVFEPCPAQDAPGPRETAGAECAADAPRRGRRRGKPLALLGALLSLVLAAGCAPGLDGRLESASEYSARKPAETEAWFAENPAPLTLQTCRALAHERTLKLTEARLSAELARLSSTAAFSAFLPQVSATYSRSGTDDTLYTEIPALGLRASMQDRWTTQAAITVTQPVFAPNAWLLWLASRRGAEMQELITQRNEELLDVQVASLFYQAAVADRMIEAYTAQAEASETLKRRIDALAAKGLALKGEAARAEALLAGDRYNLQVARDNAKAAKANLLDILNFYPLSDAAPAPDGESLLSVLELPWALTDADGTLRPCTRGEALAAPLEEWLWAALVNRREMWAGDMRIVLHKVQALAALAHFLPTLSLSGGGAYSSNSHLTPDSYLTGGIGGVMSVFDGLVSVADYLSARRQEEAAYALREDAAATLIVSVWQAKTNLDQARRLKSVAETRLHAAETDYDETFSRYEQDQETLSEVLDKFSVREQARIQAISAAYADALAEYVFRDAVGLGWGDAVSRPKAETPVPLLPKTE